MLKKVIGIFLEKHVFTKEISNIRRARAGRTVEEILIRVLRAFKIPCERGKEKSEGTLILSFYKII